jgi:hypothetical protein
MTSGMTGQGPSPTRGGRSQLTIRDAIEAHLYPTPPRHGVQYKSSLIALLTDARGATGRDLDTGSVVTHDHTRSWLGATGYLILLDQVGTCFQRVGAKVPADNPIARALKQFSHVTDDARMDAIYALRHALAHDYALYNTNSKHPNRQHAFNFTADAHTPLVVLPHRPWSGSYNAIRREEVTVVNLRALGDLGEAVVANLRQLHEQQRLGITMDIAEFMVRYGLYYAV